MFPEPLHQQKISNIVTCISHMAHTITNLPDNVFITLYKLICYKIDIFIIHENLQQVSFTRQNFCCEIFQMNTPEAQLQLGCADSVPGLQDPP